MVQNFHIRWGCTTNTTNFDQSFGEKPKKKLCQHQKVLDQMGNKIITRRGFIHNVESIIRLKTKKILMVASK